ncbi:DUF1471 domain-containing protein [Salmonella enterica]|uniref:DUF1471 domain-containing protein n=1 Tax=Salmonella enterica subsp. enterica serovar Javiana TaxID=363569 RepID=A0A607KHS9_SALET|nr:DUF1471 domain-containing protein [Salmonella enterica]EAR0120208.1 DUF1471 domain-containing protein [Salmonella enterica subsp. enterica serovar Javiana]EBF4799750.1 DUF1471 domain-containing protein [Salmonella enterica subsp. enterica]EDY0542903.1 DUF1471 domain-containing protein [Salmonella enterica subsp. enterica serovar Panama]EAN6964754.1 DUF1471 domain-containing protein [Salmonella enterica]
MLSTAFAAEPVSGLQAEKLNKTGIVSGNADTLSELESVLRDKADSRGATVYRITSASTKNKASGTAIIYQ